MTFRYQLRDCAVGVLFAVGLFAPLTVQAANTPKVMADGIAPLEAFKFHPDFDSPRISPDGQRIAAKMNVDGEEWLTILDVSGKGAKPIPVANDGAFDKTGDKRIASWTWADSDNLVLTITERVDYAGQPVDASALAGFYVPDRKITPLGWDTNFVFGGNILWTDPKGSEEILVSRWSNRYGTERLTKPEVIRMNVRTGKFETVERPNPVISGWSADGHGQVRMGVSSNSDSGQLRVLYRAPGESNYKTIIKQKSEKYKTIPTPEIFLKDGKTAIALSNHEGYEAVYKLDLETMELGDKVFGVDGYDVTGVSGGKNGDELAAVYYAKDASGEVKYFEPDLAEIQKLLNELHGGKSVTISSTNSDRTRILYSVSSAANPGAFYLFDTDTGKVNLIGYNNALIGNVAMNPARVIRYQASDGKMIEAILTMPRHRSGTKPLPLIINPHGGPWARDYLAYNPAWAQPLAEMGYVVIQPNYRGSSGYGHDWEAAADGNWGLRMQDDLDDAITYLAAQGIVDPKRVCMLGWSYGGYASARAAQRDADKYRCAIAGAGPYDLREMVKHDKDYLGRYGSTYIGEAGLLDAISPALHTDGKWAPILIVHGKRDERVPVEQARELVNHLKKSGKREGIDFEYLEQARNTHHFPLDEQQTEFLKASKAFLDKHNPAFIPSDADYKLGAKIDDAMR
ncbi:S9 family peptidase [Sphingorhabdus soli]|uniref:S9 family peptidase n=1 Tax=Flavisphingopyxis soli TaxID=2601267 RepID=A0A5C6USG3_9SPHN|nr:S9 family peptidase [Sphingorhabdus soli]TXC73745.1 S9 family peptidase [Sphingorhabdus soli]